MPLVSYTNSMRANETLTKPLLIRVTHILSILPPLESESLEGNTSPMPIRGQLPPSIDVFSSGPITIRISGFMDGKGVESERFAKSWFVDDLVQALRRVECFHTSLPGVPSILNLYPLKRIFFYSDFTKSPAYTTINIQLRVTHNSSLMPRYRLRANCRHICITF